MQSPSHDCGGHRSSGAKCLNISPAVVSKIKDKSFVGSPFEITPNTLESSFMRRLWIEGVARTLMDGKGDVRTTVSTQVEDHSNGTGVVDCPTSGGGRRHHEVAQQFLLVWGLLLRANCRVCKP